MPIKKSQLEKKRYYRIAKIIYIILPVFVAGGFYLTKKISEEDVTKNWLTFALILVAYYVGVNLIWRLFLYLAFGGLENDTPSQAKETAPPPSGQPATKSPSPAPRPNPAAGIAVLIVVLVIVIILLFFSERFPIVENLKNFFNNINTNTTITNNQNSSPARNTSPANNTNANNNPAVPIPAPTPTPEPTPTCVSTGCGSDWYCSGHYYFEGVRVPISGCFPTGGRPGDIYSSWSGSCRQCP